MTHSVIKKDGSKFDVVLTISDVEKLSYMVTDILTS